jgi:hypothetical protein
MFYMYFLPLKGEKRGFFVIWGYGLSLCHFVGRVADSCENSPVHCRQTNRFKKSLRRYS